MRISRRDFMQAAAAIGASLAWGGAACASRTRWRERRDLYPEGVASGDPDPHSVILWTRRPFDEGERHVLTVEVAEDEAFRRVIAHAPAPVSAAADWTTRVLVGGLKPARVYWYRFTDADGNGSRVGRTITAPAADDPRPVNFAFVSCQDVNEGKLNAYRRMIFEDERAAPSDQLGFVLHLGDFIYEVVEYPDEVKTRYDRTIYEVARIPDGGKIGNFHIPLTLDGYRAVYKAISPIPTCRTRARAGRSSPCGTITNSPGRAGRASRRPATASGRARASRSPPTRRGSNICRRACKKRRADLARTASSRLQSRTSRSRSSTRTASAIEPNNLVAINSLIGYRALRYGKHLDLIITDQHSYRSADPFSDPSLGKLGARRVHRHVPRGRRCRCSTAAARSTAAIRRPRSASTTRTSPNPQKERAAADHSRRRAKGLVQGPAARATATWKIWGNSQGTLDVRADPQNLPPG